MIIVPYVAGMLRPRTAETPGAEFVALTGDPYAYWRLLVRVYEAGYDATIVEQDIIITPAQLYDLDDCSSPWCAYGYDRGGAELVALGALRIRKEIHATHPDLLRRDTPDRVRYDQCDGWLYTRLKAVGYAVHRHYPNVGHDPSARRVLHEYDVRTKVPLDRIAREPYIHPDGIDDPDRVGE